MASRNNAENIKKCVFYNESNPGWCMHSVNPKICNKHASLFGIEYERRVVTAVHGNDSKYVEMLHLANGNYIPYPFIGAMATESMIKLHLDSIAYPLSFKTEEIKYCKLKIKQFFGCNKTLMGENETELGTLLLHITDKTETIVRKDRYENIQNDLYNALFASKYISIIVDRDAHYVAEEMPTLIADAETNRFIIINTQYIGYKSVNATHSTPARIAGEVAGNESGLTGSNTGIRGLLCA